MVNTNNHPPLLLASQRSATHKQHLTEGVPSSGTCVSFLCCFVGKLTRHRSKEKLVIDRSLYSNICNGLMQPVYVGHNLFLFYL